MVSRIFYRVWQSWQTVTGSLSEQDLEDVRQDLSPAEIELFQSMSLADQAHSLRVYRALAAEGRDHPALLTAALLHDAGKADRSFNLFDRTAVVLLKKFLPGSYQSRGRSGSKGWERAVFIAREHPRWGAELAQEAGSDPLAVWLIRHHQADLSTLHAGPEKLGLLSFLKQADNQN
ncbi:MAG: HD domain-containing protein [Anaerolineales bacterium]|nr:HD domain-containing protein [Anaerolineales bacterium]